MHDLIICLRLFFNPIIFYTPLGNMTIKKIKKKRKKTGKILSPSELMDFDAMLCNPFSPPAKLDHQQLTVFSPLFPNQFDHFVQLPSLISLTFSSIPSS
jgi:hypothetical protein